MVEIEVATPPGGGRCFVAVHRLPTFANPTPDWRSEVLYQGVAPCGVPVKVDNIIDLREVGRNDTAILYDSPQYIVVISKNGSHIGVVTPTITRIHVAAHLEKSGAVAGADPESFCNVTIQGQTYSPEPEDWGYCTAPTKLACLNSIQGLQVRFKVQGGVPASAMYLEGWGAACMSDLNRAMEPCEADAWSSAGKFRAFSVVAQVSDVLADGQRAVVWGYVYYQYEHYAYSDWGGFAYYVYDLLYPAKITGLAPLQMAGLYTQPPAPPSYASGPLRGDVEVWLTPTKTTDNKLPISTSIGVGIGVYGFSLSITVSPYEAGDDSTTRLRP